MKMARDAGLLLTGKDRDYIGGLVPRVGAILRIGRWLIGAYVLALALTYLHAAYGLSALDYWLDRYQTGIGAIIAAATLYALLRQANAERKMHAARIAMDFRREKETLQVLTFEVARIARVNASEVTHRAFGGRTVDRHPLIKNIGQETLSAVRQHCSPPVFELVRQFSEGLDRFNKFAEDRDRDLLLRDARTPADQDVLRNLIGRMADECLQTARALLSMLATEITRVEAHEYRFSQT